MIDWNYMFVSIVLLIVALIIIGTSALGIFLSRKNKALKNYTSKVPTIIFVGLLSIIAFSIEFIILPTEVLALFSVLSL